MIIKAYMVPHPPIAIPEIGKGETKQCETTIQSFQMIAKEIAELKPDTIIVISPHATMYRDYFDISGGESAYGDFTQFHCPVSIEVQYDMAFIDCLKQTLPESFPAGDEYNRDVMLDHGTMVPLYFIEKEYSDFKLVRIGLSGLPLTMHYALGMGIQKAAEQLDRRIVFIGSGDLSHCQKADGPYGYHKEGPAYDEKIMKTMGTAAFDELFDYPHAFLDAAMECGHRSFVIMAGALDGIALSTHVYSHEAPFGVGYGFVSFTPKGKDENRHFLSLYEEKEREKITTNRKTSDPYVKLAYAAVEEWVKQRTRIMPPEEVKGCAGVFVSIHEHGQLRGCIGTISPCYDNIAREIIQNAISACSKDPRFNPITEEELPYLEISVDVLGEPEEIPDSSYLNVKKYGVICSTKDGRRGLLLPDLEGVDTVEQQVKIACQKGGIDQQDEDVILERFEVVRHV